VFNDATGIQSTGIPWTPDGLNLVFELTSSTEFSLTINTQSFAGALMNSSEAVIRKFRAWNFSAGSGESQNFYIIDMNIDGVPLSAGGYEDEVTLTRPFGSVSDQDQDGFLRWQEEFAGTDPADAGSHLPDIDPARTQDVISVWLPTSTPSRWYDLFCRTNLVEGEWTRCGVEALGWGGPLSLTVTNGESTAFYRTGVYAP